MFHKREFIKFNNEICPFKDSKCVTVFTDLQKYLSPEVKYLILNEIRTSDLSCYYGTSWQNSYLEMATGLKFIFSEYKTKLTPMQMLQYLCSFKTNHLGDLTLFIVMNFNYSDKSCYEQAFINGLKKAVDDIKRMYMNVKLLFILPSKANFKVQHDLWLLSNEKGLIRKISEEESNVFTCTQEAVNELRNSLIYRSIFDTLAYIGTSNLDIEEPDMFKSQMSKFNKKFDEYYEVS